MLQALLIAGAAAAPTKSIVETAIATPSLSTLVKVLTAPGYEPVLQALSGPGPFTVFAPDNNAFARAGLNISHVEYVTTTLQYHVLSGKVSSKDLAPLQFVRTLASDPKYITLPKPGTQFVGVEKNAQGVTTLWGLGSSKVTTADVECTNGVVHIINAVEFLPQNTSRVAQEARLNILVQAVVKAGLVSVIDETPGLTIFAPTDDAFTAVGWEKLTVDQLTAVLKYHVVAAEAFSTDLKDGQSIPTVLGKDVKVGIKGGVVSINNAVVRFPNVITRNAVVHVIDKVLIPPTF